jgi:hypothetical protein
MYQVRDHHGFTTRSASALISRDTRSVISGEGFLLVFERKILEKKWEYNGTVHQLFIDFKKAYDSEGSIIQHSH